MPTELPNSMSNSIDDIANVKQSASGSELRRLVTQRSSLRDALPAIAPHQTGYAQNGHVLDYRFSPDGKPPVKRE